MVTDSQVREALSQVLDPEVGENIIDLGLVYRIDIRPRSLAVAMTMTSPSCPMGGWIQQQVQQQLDALCAGDQQAQVELVWEPAWTPELMSPALRARLGWA